MFKNNKLVKIGGLILVGLLLFIIIGKRAGWIGAAEQIRVNTEKVERRTIVELVSASGKVQPVTEVKISPDVSGEIVDLPVKEGDYVRRGDLLARINPDLYLSALDRIEASLNTSKANLANARARGAQSEAQFINAQASFGRSERLFGQNAISEAEFDAARAQYLVAKSDVEAGKQSVIAAEYQVRSAEAALKEARESLSKTNIFAPMDGTISRLDAKPGERVVGTSQFAGTEIMRLANLNEMEILVEVNENDIIRVNEGDTATVEIDAYQNEKFKGVVTSIANSALSKALTVDQVTNFEVRIRILPESYQHLIREDQKHTSPFRPGMSASVDIQTRKVVDVLSVPIQAVTTREPKASPADTTAVEEVPATTLGTMAEYVFVVDGGKVRLQAIKSGIQDSHHIEILEGLEGTEEIVTGPFRVVSRTLKDGDAVVRSQRGEAVPENE